jgi:deazaflavin-dependent oxidoreductase (nitroreductase family)
MHVKDFLFRAATAVHRRLYRRTGGRVGGRIAKSPVLLLTTMGRRTGKRRTTPLLYVRDGDRLAVVASKGGDDRAPMWYLNLKANPDVEVEVGPVSRRMRAATADPGEHAALWRKAVQMYPPYDAYQAKTRRRIPIVVLTPE